MQVDKVAVSGMGLRTGSEAFDRLRYILLKHLIKLFIKIGNWIKLCMSSPDMASIGIA